jgi:hypothetical protein
MITQPNGEAATRAVLTFLKFLVVVAAVTAFVVLPGSKHVVEYFGDCSPPSPGGTCVPPHRTVLVGDNYVGVRAAIALAVLTLLVVGRHLIRRARRRSELAASD